jgi:hypothetical protein
MQLDARYLAGKKNISADALSRLESPYDWKLHPVVFQQIENRFGPHTVDRFAAFHNRQLPRYNSRFCDPETEGVDAFSQNWSKENNFINAPFRLLPIILKKLRAKRP